jgi:glycosyltransferase involved in cell wall biosynthesis
MARRTRLGLALRPWFLAVLEAMVSRVKTAERTAAEAADSRQTGLVASVIVPARNGGAGLRHLMAALEAQTMPRDAFEVVIGDDGSTDGSADSLATEDGRVKVVSGPPLNSYAARNRGVGASRAPVLAFCDADCRPEPGWLEAGTRALGQAEIVAGVVRLVVAPTPTAWTLLDLDMSKDQARSVRNGKAETANLFVRRELFDRVGGFDDSLPSGGDRDFVQRCAAAGGRLILARDAIVWHPTRDRAKSFLAHIWRIHRARGARSAASGRRRRRFWINTFYVPILGTVRSRRAAERSLRLDRGRLAENGVQARLRDDLRALPILYLLLPYVAGVAKLAGRLDARHRRQTLARNDSLVQSGSETK